MSSQAGSLEWDSAGNDLQRASEDYNMYTDCNDKSTDVEILRLVIIRDRSFQVGYHLENLSAYRINVFTVYFLNTGFDPILLMIILY